MKQCVAHSATLVASLLFCLVLTPRAIGSEVELHVPASHGGDEVSSPTLPQSSTWPGTTVIVILGMFLAAAAVGPIVRANMPEDVPLAAHDEPPGSSHHHGSSGTLEHDPGHGHGH